MCTQTFRGILLGSLVFPFTYVLAGCIQVAVGIIFMFIYPVFRFASNLWAGTVNIALGCAFTALICCGKSNIAKHRACLGISVGVVLINLGNLLVMEICEWRAFLPAFRLLDITRHTTQEMLLTAYLGSTITSAATLVIGFIGCEYVYCLLIAGSRRSVEATDKAGSIKRSFPCRQRRASSYEPISFSWVFEASDNFHSAHNTLMRNNNVVTPGGPTRPGGNKTFSNVDLLSNDPGCVGGDVKCNGHPENSTYTIEQPLQAESSMSLNPVAEAGSLLWLANGTASTAVVDGKKKDMEASSGAVSQAGLPRTNSKSSSGYSSPDWLLHQQCNVQSLMERRSQLFHHYENVDFAGRDCMHLSQDSIRKGYGDGNRKPARESCSLVQLPSAGSGPDLAGRRGMATSSSPIHQSTLPMRGSRKRSLSDSNKSRGHGRPYDGSCRSNKRKRHKTDSTLSHGSVEETSFYAIRRPRLSSTPESGYRLKRLPNVPDVSFIERTSPTCRENEYKDNDQDQRTVEIQSDLPSSSKSPTPLVTETNARSVAAVTATPCSDNEVIFDVTAEYAATKRQPNRSVSQSSSFQTTPNAPSTSVTTPLESPNEKKEVERSATLDSISMVDSLLTRSDILDEISANEVKSNGVPSISVEMDPEYSPEESPAWKLFRKPSWKSVKSVSSSPGCKRNRLGDNGIVFQSLDRRLKEKYLESGYGQENSRNSQCDSIPYWKPSDRPKLSPVALDDCDSLVNLSNLELLARQWRTVNFHQRSMESVFTKKSLLN